MLQLEKYELLVACDSNGKVPFVEWLLSLDPEVRNRVRARLARIRDGNFGDCCSLKNGLFELRMFFGGGLRIYFGKIDEKIVLLLNAGDKSRQSKDIFKAFKLLLEYKNENNKIRRPFK